ncbi:Di-copper centre-containing protein [Tuber magnatum]|uniref:Di-copper centre-containing protein n=1 Tax=Tuber magnatum TaxID=42249 RepID=A0A317STV4_9PEZI|nr:Di-copper centre-containing protein [Tuber magnatum]
MSTKGTTGLPETRTRFDDLLAVHQTQSANVHNDGWFLPFHRLLMHAHETLLRTECGYTGGQPYWDEAHEAGQFTQSLVFSADDTGFGGDGVLLDGDLDPIRKCIRDGPFASYRLHNGPGYSNTEHCINRAISNQSSLLSSRGQIDNCLGKPNFQEAWPCIEANPHKGGHAGVGGEMDNPISSPGDPLFYLHHTFLDRVWWQWQEKDLSNRVFDIAGYTTGSEPAGGWVLATLDDELDMKRVIPNERIGDIMDIRGGVLCYEYI